MRELRVNGAVQGVGFRPFVYRTAAAHGVGGWVLNDSNGVTIRAIGSADCLNGFQKDIKELAPAPGHVQSILVTSETDADDFEDFRIMESRHGGVITASVTPDLATCADCLKELFNPSDRRHLYPFINCTHCGPRYSMLEHIPYDRPNTTMKRFTMCRRCETEYENPLNRRFHAQPNACPDCGPQAALWDRTGRILSGNGYALSAAAELVLDGRIVAVKGLGGFHLMADACNKETVLEFRRRKNREEKPFAVMFPDMDQVRRYCRVTDMEETLLSGSEAPIVLLSKLDARNLLEVSSNPLLGAMLPYTPLHHILLHYLKRPVVATSGNLTDEPICVDEHEALYRLNGIADAFLVHDRPIARPVDDSIIRVAAGRAMLLRRARGYAPKPVDIGHSASEPLLAVGGQLKNTVAVAIGREAFISQHVGDLDTEPALQAFEDAVCTLQELYRSYPARMVCDLHPDYASTRWVWSLAESMDKTGNPDKAGCNRVNRCLSGESADVMAVQHHHAHIVSCMIDNGLSGSVLGIAWDGTGYGGDGTVWGGELLLADRGSYERLGHLRHFRLPGGDQAVREPRRSAIGLLYEVFGESLFHMRNIPSVQAFDPSTLRVMHRMLGEKVQSPRTSSTGRLFDAVASLLDIRHVSTFEGQAAMDLEFVSSEAALGEHRYHIPFDNTADWEPMIINMITDLREGVDRSLMAGAFHKALANLIVDMARRAEEKRVVLSGGCFQNVRLLELAVTKLRQAGFDPYWHRNIPANDGGISLGQLGIAINNKRRI